MNEEWIERGVEDWWQTNPTVAAQQVEGLLEALRRQRDLAVRSDVILEVAEIVGVEASYIASADARQRLIEAVARAIQTERDLRARDVATLQAAVAGLQNQVLS
jgi:hypothetical protein